MIEVSVIFLLLLLMGKSIDSGSTGLSRDLESEWDEIFGHLSYESIPSKLPIGYSSLGKHGQSKISTSKDTPKIHGKEKNATVTRPKPRPPAPPAAPFVYNPEDPEKIPNIGAQSLGSMEGIAISQNGATSIGMFIMNSSYNSFSTLFGSSQNTQTQPKALKLDIT
ncbi:hypothetical protein Ocin01_11535 [Orchesella cincta]|uniref:Uncharacterized protein n=1 Tax=Orchesella cincta TaxID=48709 RepID=A0A1D2MQS0_ORCCI|nr:hypothetical protein Ocin01_11535 [Orchesella cincta]